MGAQRASERFYVSQPLSCKVKRSVLQVQFEVSVEMGSKTRMPNERATELRTGKAQLLNLQPLVSIEEQSLPGSREKESKNRASATPAFLTFLGNAPSI